MGATKRRGRDENLTSGSVTGAALRRRVSGGRSKTNKAGIDSGNCGAPFKIMDARLHGHGEKSHRKRKRRSGPAGLLLPLALDPFDVGTVPIGIETRIAMPKGAGVEIGVGISHRR